MSTLGTDFQWELAGHNIRSLDDIRIKLLTGSKSVSQNSKCAPSIMSII